MDVRREVYSNINEALSGLYDTTEPNDRLFATNSLLKHYRSAYLWGSKRVVNKFRALLDALNLDTKRSHEEIDKLYKEFILVMGNELSGKRGLKVEDAKIYGKIK